MVDESFHERVKQRMDRVDSLPKELRALVHEHGLTVVDAFLQCGVTKPKHIQHLIKVVRAGSAVYGNGTRGEPR